MRLSVLLALVSVAAAQGAAEPRAFFAKPMVLGAHQGGGALWPGNTLVAFESAAAKWPDILLEGDLQLTADGHVVLLHDWTVDRTTNGAGPVARKTLAEVKALDAGYRFTLDGGKTYPYRGKGVTVPTLTEVLAALPGSRFLFELKHPLGLGDAVPPVIQAAHAEERVALASFSSPMMRRVRELDPRIITCYDVATGMEMVKALRNGAWAKYEPTAEILAIDEDMIRGFVLTPVDFRAIRDKGIAISIHTINSPAKMRSFIEMGVDCILTDRPDTLAGVLGLPPRGDSTPRAASAAETPAN